MNCHCCPNWGANCAVEGEERRDDKRLRLLIRWIGFHQEPIQPQETQPMYKVCSIFSQVLKLFSRGDFEQAVKEHKAERHARGFTSLGQFMAMLFCQLGQAHSLREICAGLACGEGQLKHLGVPVAPKRSTLAYANEHRPWELRSEEHT